jgi:ribosome-binding factor A
MNKNWRRDALFGAAVSRPPRSERVAQQLREEISALMQREMKDPRVQMASVSEVQLSGDLRQARVRISFIGEDADRNKVVEALQHAEGFIRGRLSARLENLHSAPKLRFELDESIAYSVHLSQVMRDLENQRDSQSD